MNGVVGCGLAGLGVGDLDRRRLARGRQGEGGGDQAQAQRRKGSGQRPERRRPGRAGPAVGLLVALRRVVVTGPVDVGHESPIGGIGAHGADRSPGPANSGSARWPPLGAGHGGVHAPHPPTPSGFAGGGLPTHATMSGVARSGPACRHSKETRTMSSPAVPAVRIDPGHGSEAVQHPGGQGVRSDRRQGLRRRRRRRAGDACRTPSVTSAFDAEAQAQLPRVQRGPRRGTDDYMAMEGQFARYLEDHYSAPPIEREAADRRVRDRSSSAAASPVCCSGTSSPRPASTTSASARRAATSAAPGTGTAIRASPATSSPTPTCRCSTRPATSRR